MLEAKTCKDLRYTIYIAGDYSRARAICEEFCNQGFCVSINPKLYIYKHGQEEGVEVTVINYARFPSEAGPLYLKTRQLAGTLLEGLNQGSFTICGLGKSIFYSRRENDQCTN